MPLKDPEARRIYQKQYHRDWYLMNRQEQYTKNKQRNTEILIWFKSLKKQMKCERCAESHPACLDFHHRDASKKEINLANAVHKNWGKERILLEISKCIILCSNCHRKEHYKERVTAFNNPTSVTDDLRSQILAPLSAEKLESILKIMNDYRID
jgi:hypothetical protein